MKLSSIFLIAPFLFAPFLFSGQVKIGTNIVAPNSLNYYGRSVSISSNNSIIAVGGEGFNSFAGVVRVYEYQGGDWMQIGSDIVGNAGNAQFGTSISLSSDGTILAAGAPNGDSYHGYVGIYENQGGTWTQIGYITGFGSNALSGNSVDLSSDGTIVAIGAFNFNNGRGYFRVYENQSGTWVQKGSDVYGENATDQFGYSVSLSSDGSIIAVSSRNYSSGTGNVKVYQYQTDSWVQLGTTIVGEGSNDQFGYDTNLSSTGDVLAIGGPNNNGSNGGDTGHVKIYEFQAGDWSQIGTDIEGETAGDQLGISVSLSSDGLILATGSTGHNSNTGYVKIYKNISGVWTQIGSDIDGESAGDLSGNSVGLSPDASTVVIGSIGTMENGIFTGHARVFDLSALLSSDEFLVSQFSLYPNPTKNEFYIKLSQGLELEKVNIYNYFGQSILSTKNVTIGTNDLASGVYYVEIETNQGKATKKIIVD